MFIIPPASYDAFVQGVHTGIVDYAVDATKAEIDKQAPKLHAQIAEHGLDAGLTLDLQVRVRATTVQDEVTVDIAVG